ncbi:MAG: hypothetical protein LC723_00125 [Actinobacteria bacterium]|nr:hypothetical protein [Actinomycetota bacterium]
MNARTGNGRRFGLMGEWAAYISMMTICLERRGLLGCALFLLACSVSHLAIRSKNRWLTLVSPVALGAVAMSAPSLGLATIAASGVAVGAGAAAAGRPGAWLSMLTAAPSWAGVLGALLSAILGLVSGPVSGLWAAVGLLLLASVLRENHDEPGRGPLLGAPALGIAFAMGLRILEPAFINGAESSVLYSLAWVVGAQIGSRSAYKADPRSVLAMPFVFAAALAAFGKVAGPGSIFLYGITGAASMMVLHSASAASAVRPAPKVGQVLALLAGWVWAVSIGAYDLPVTLWVVSGVVLVAGFAGLVSVRAGKQKVAVMVAAGPVDADALSVSGPTALTTAPIPDAATTGQLAVASLVNGPAEGSGAAAQIDRPVQEAAGSETAEPTEEELIAVAELLLASLKSARQIRAEALAAFYSARHKNQLDDESIERWLGMMSEVRSRLASR